VDPERLPDDTEEMRAVGMGAVYTATSGRGVLLEQDSLRDAALVTRYFAPYAEALTHLVDQRIAATGRAVIIDLHSYPKAALPYELHAGTRRPEVCLGVDDFHTPDWLLSAAQSAFAGVGDVDMPFAGTYVPLRHFSKDNRAVSVMIEIRRDTYMYEPGGEMHGGAGEVVKALTQVVRSVDGEYGTRSVPCFEP